MTVAPFRKPIRRRKPYGPRRSDIQRATNQAFARAVWQADLTTEGLAAALTARGIETSAGAVAKWRLGTSPTSHKVYAALAEILTKNGEPRSLDEIEQMFEPCIASSKPRKGRK